MVLCRCCVNYTNSSVLYLIYFVASQCHFIMPEEKCLEAYCICVTLPNSSIPTQSMQMIVCLGIKKSFKLGKM